MVSTSVEIDSDGRAIVGLDLCGSFFSEFAGDNLMTLARLGTSSIKVFRYKISKSKQSRRVRVVLWNIGYPV